MSSERIRSAGPPIARHSAANFVASSPHRASTWRTSEVAAWTRASALEEAEEMVRSRSMRSMPRVMLASASRAVLQGFVGIVRSATEPTSAARA